jgi:hypothetical protein
MSKSDNSFVYIIIVLVVIVVVGLIYYYSNRSSTDYLKQNCNNKLACNLHKNMNSQFNCLNNTQQTFKQVQQCLSDAFSQHQLYMNDYLALKGFKGPNALIQFSDHIEVIMKPKMDKLTVEEKNKIISQFMANVKLDAMNFIKKHQINIQTIAKEFLTQVQMSAWGNVKPLSSIAELSNQFSAIEGNEHKPPVHYSKAVGRSL